MRAALHGHLGIVELLIANNADINVKASNGRSALMWAISRGHKETVSLLIDKGADVCAPDPIILIPPGAEFDNLSSTSAKEVGCLPDLTLNIGKGRSTLDALQTVFNASSTVFRILVFFLSGHLSSIAHEHVMQVQWKKLMPNPFWH